MPSHCSFTLFGELLPEATNWANTFHIPSFFYDPPLRTIAPARVNRFPTLGRLARPPLLRVPEADTPPMSPKAVVQKVANI